MDETIEKCDECLPVEDECLPVEDECLPVEDECLPIEESNNKTKQLSRSARKRKHYEELLQQKRELRKQKKLEKKARVQQEREKEEETDEGMERKSKRDMKEETKRKLEQSLKVGQRICIDCSLEQHMSEKEMGKLAMQIGRLYGSNKKGDNPAHLYLTGLTREGILYKECIKKNDGFLNYFMDIEEKEVSELFPLDKIVYLSPDADQALSDIYPECVYVIGGLVDESISKNISRTKADTSCVRTARLPIEEHMVKVKQTSYSKVLSVNQVFDILMAYLSTRSWKEALSIGVPKRKGYVLKPDTGS